MDEPGKPPCAAALALTALALTKLLLEVRDPLDAVRQSLDGHNVPLLLGMACDDLQRSLYAFIMVLGAAVLAELLDRIRWTLAGGVGPLERASFAAWLAGALHWVRTFAQADVEAKP